MRTSKVILVTGIGGDIAQGVATILRTSRPELRLVGVDGHTQHGGRAFVDAFETVPYASDLSYPAALRDVARRHGVDTLIPMSEPELGALLGGEAEFGGIAWIACGERVVRIGLDKLLTAREIAGLGLPVPWTVEADHELPLDFPCILKARFGSGSRSVFMVENEEDARFLRKRHPGGVFQEMLEPANREVTCAVYRTADARVAVLQMLRRLTGGFTGWAKVIEDPEVRQMCETVAHGLGLRGSMNVQLRITDAGPRVFEINPRFSSTVLMRHRLGFSDVLWALGEAEGRPVQLPRETPVGQVMVRVQDELVLDSPEEISQ
jgi:carbamoyl-phosphate synthase large subunit